MFHIKFTLINVKLEYQIQKSFEPQHDNGSTSQQKLGNASMHALNGTEQNFSCVGVVI
jgi:hypothetical protein